MIRPVFLLAIVLLSLSAKAQQKWPELELQAVRQLKANNSQFDLSGIGLYQGALYLISDKAQHAAIYKAEMREEGFYLIDKLPLRPESIRDLESAALDLEAICNCGDTWYLANENDNQVYSFSQSEGFRLVPTDLKAFGESREDWLTNAGIEGMAVDCASGWLYLAKERQPRAIYKLELATGKVHIKAQIPETESNDISDMVYQDGYLYVLERNGNYVTKVNASTFEVVGKLSYRNVCSSPAGKLYEPSRYGMGEAIALTDTEIWIGIDNNGISASPYGQKYHGLEGNQPAILIFKRPAGF